jgi:hypothetical protein
MQEFLKKLTKSNTKSQENSTYIFNGLESLQQYHKTTKECVWKYLEISFKDFWTQEHIELSQI